MSVPPNLRGRPIALRTHRPPSMGGRRDDGMDDGTSNRTHIGNRRDDEDRD